MQPKNMPFVQSSCVDSSRSGLNALSSATGWTPAFSEVRRSNETEKRRGEWQRNLYLSAMTNEESPPYAQWPFVIRNTIVHEHGSDAHGDCFFATPYPYATKKCQHFLFFPAFDLQTAEIDQRLTNKLPGQDFVWYCNPKSKLKQCGKHYHVFVKK